MLEHEERKVIRIGNNIGVVLPTDLVKKWDVKLGDSIQFEEKEGDIIMSKNKKKNIELPEGISEDFFEVLTETVEQYDGAFKGLVDK